MERRFYIIRDYSVAIGKGFIFVDCRTKTRSLKIDSMENIKSLISDKDVGVITPVLAYQRGYFEFQKVLPDQFFSKFNEGEI